MRLLKNPATQSDQISQVPAVSPQPVEAAPHPAGS